MRLSSTDYPQTPALPAWSCARICTPCQSLAVASPEDAATFTMAGKAEIATLVQPHAHQYMCAVGRHEISKQSQSILCAKYVDIMIDRLDHAVSV